MSGLLAPPEILTRTNWKSWKNEIEKHARNQGVWKFCDPDALDKCHPELHEPEKPRISTVRPEAQSIVDLGEDDFIELSSIVDRYWKKMQVYDKIQAGLGVVFNLIKYHVDAEYFDLIEHAETPLDQMMLLSAKFKKPRLEDLQPRWELIQRLASAPEVQELFELWNLFFTDCNRYQSCDARRQDAFWECVDMGGDVSGNWLPLTAQDWIEKPDHVESAANWNDSAQSRSPARQESPASQSWIKPPDHIESINHWGVRAQPRSPIRRESIDSQYCVGDYKDMLNKREETFGGEFGSDFTRRLTLCQTQDSKI
ncbi:uncharacterized protein N7479_010405 [Penicillium vulpinum]|uniref:Uncharacterized protein n=1 Tax=Penicillium vulpinum TaxID=29845 RepID=A0A1V6S8W6_9EURO|nr:uncharacterized protein N7479_010405 [Penicillium vulpinum]KAJ5951992.1 hypothetical protein N7479_010405 [Penicillium vulpinum]OQE10492.1 hypothetical protein PENVUL_c004G01957 [Penicillium vulpinum]